MPKVLLTHSFCATACCTAGKARIDYFDEDVLGFILECRSSGGRTYYLRYDHAGKQKQINIGRYEDVSFAQAKKAAQRLRSTVVLGENPAAIKAEAKAVPTFKALAEQHIVHARMYMRSIKTFEGYMKRIVSRWGRFRLTDICQQDISTWLAELRAAGLAPATLEKVRVTMHRSFELGARWQVPGAQVNPVKGVPRPRFSNSRERTITPEEVSRLLLACKRSRNNQLAAIIQLLLCTGMRVGELLSSRRSDLDLSRRNLFVPFSKNGRSRHVPLSGPATQTIEELSLRPDDIWLLPNPINRTQHLTTVKHAWQTARSLAGLPDLRVHDLRHAAASAMVQAGVDLFTVGKVLGHASYASTARYSHVNNDRLLAVVELGAAQLFPS